MEKVNFWRTTNKTDIDFIIQNEGRLNAVEVKWSDSKRPKSFYTIESLYPEMKTHIITSDYFLK